MTFSHYILRIYATLEYQENFLPAPENERSISSFRVILVQQVLWLFRHGNFDVREIPRLLTSIHTIYYRRSTFSAYIGFRMLHRAAPQR